MNAAYRQLYIFQSLLTGHVAVKAELTSRFDVTPRVIQRDFSQLREFLAAENLDYRLTYSRRLNGYQLQGTQTTITKQSILLLIKVLLASRSLPTVEMNRTITSLLSLSIPDDQREIQPIIKNELFHYHPLQHQQPLLDRLWQFSQFITQKQPVTIIYQKQHREIVTRTILPEAVIFSEYYFYVVAYNAKYRSNLFYRLDRIRHFQTSNQVITRNRAERFEDGELRQLIHYMTPGQKVTLRFKFWGIVEAALDRFPTAKIISHHSDYVIIETIAFDLGAKMWLLSQGNNVEVIAPAEFVASMKTTLAEMTARYH